MTEGERREDEILKKQIQEAYGCSDEQLLAELDELEATISDSDFPGAEERIYQKLLARAEEEEAGKENENKTSDMDTNTAASVSAEMPAEELAGEPTAEPVCLSDEPVKKHSRFGKKKVLLAAVLAAAFAGMLGMTAIGEKNYFFRLGSGRSSIVVDNDQNAEYKGNLKEVYAESEEKLGIRVIQFNYLPQDMVFSSAEIGKYKAVLEFEYGENTIHVIQEKKTKETSLSVESDRDKCGTVQSKWLNVDIEYSSNVTETGQTEYEAMLIYENGLYYLFGIVEEEEFVKILENLSFY